MRSSSKNPFSYSFTNTASAASLASDFDGKLDAGEEDETTSVSIAGRIMARRVFGKLAFFSLQDESGLIQLQFEKKKLNAVDPDAFKVKAGATRQQKLDVMLSLS